MSSTASLISLASEGACQLHTTDPTGGTTSHRHVFKKHTPMALDWHVHDLDTRSSSNTKMGRQADLLGQIFVELTLSSLKNVSTDSSARSCGGTRSMQGFVVGACKAAEEADLAIMVKSPGIATSLVTKFNNGTLTPRDIDEIKKEYATSCGGYAGCAVDNDCPCDGTFNAGSYAYWTQATGYAALSKVRFQVGGQKVDEYTREIMFCYDELSGFSGKKVMEMVNRHTSIESLICASQSEIKCYVPLHFFFTRSSANYFPIAAISFHNAELDIEWTPVTDLVCVSKTSVMITPMPTMTARLYTLQVFLGATEREMFATRAYSQVICQTQQTAIGSYMAAFLRTPIYFNLPVKYINFAVRRDAMAPGQFFNFSGINGQDTVQEATLLTNNHPRKESLSGPFMRLVEPYLFANSISSSFIYMMTFAEKPFEPHHQTAGLLNLSRLDNVLLTLKLQEGLQHESVTLFIWAENINILKFSDGLAGVAFAS